MTHMTDANNVKCGEGLIVGPIRRDAEGKYLQKNFCGKAAGGARRVGHLADKELVRKSEELGGVTNAPD
jgi:hypothetical protein